jgi:hypothetical protein
MLMQASVTDTPVLQEGCPATMSWRPSCMMAFDHQAGDAPVAAGHLLRDILAPPLRSGGWCCLLLLACDTSIITCSDAGPRLFEQSAGRVRHPGCVCSWAPCRRAG